MLLTQIFWEQKNLVYAPHVSASESHCAGRKVTHEPVSTGAQMQRTLRKLRLVTTLSHVFKAGCWRLCLVLAYCRKIKLGGLQHRNPFPPVLEPEVWNQGIHSYILLKGQLGSLCHGDRRAGEQREGTEVTIQRNAHDTYSPRPGAGDRIQGS
jgi:hypothetical protein